MRWGMRARPSRWRRQASAERVPAQAAEVEGQQGEGRELGGEGLGGGDPDLRPGMGQERPRRFAGQHRALHVADADGQGALALGLAEGGQGVRGLAALADGHGQGVRVHDGRAVAELASVVHLGGDSRDLLEQELAHERGVPARPAGEEHHPPHVLEPLGGLAQLLEVDAALFEADPPEQAVAHRARLLVDLLQHEVAIAALLGLHRVPGDALGSTGHHGPRRVLEDHRVGAHGHDLAVLQEQEVAGVGEQGGDVRGEEVLALAEAHHQGRPETSADQGLGLVLVQQHQGVDPLELRPRLAATPLRASPRSDGTRGGRSPRCPSGSRTRGPRPAAAPSGEGSSR